MLQVVKRGPTPLGEVLLKVEIPVRDSHDNTLLTIHAPRVSNKHQDSNRKCGINLYVIIFNLN